MANYVDEARKYLQGSYDTAVSNLKNNFNQNMKDMDNQTANMNKQYDSSVQGAKQTGQQNKANYNARELGMGMARSSIMGTGLSGIENQTADNVNKLEVERQSQLANISSLKDMLRNNLTNSLSAAESDYNSKLNDYAMQLRNRDEDVAYRNRQLAMQQQEQAEARAWKQKEFDAQQYWKQKDYELSQAKSKQSSSAFNSRDFATDTDSAISEALANDDKETANQLLKYAKLNGVNQSILKEWKSAIDDYIPKSLQNYAKTGNMDWLQKYTSDGKGIYLNPKYKG